MAATVIAVAVALTGLGIVLGRFVVTISNWWAATTLVGVAGAGVCGWLALASSELDSGPTVAGVGLGVFLVGWALVIGMSVRDSRRRARTEDPTARRKFAAFGEDDTRVVTSVGAAIKDLHNRMVHVERSLMVDLPAGLPGSGGGVVPALTDIPPEPLAVLEPAPVHVNGDFGPDDPVDLDDVPGGAGDGDESDLVDTGELPVVSTEGLPDPLTPNGDVTSEIDLGGIHATVRYRSQEAANADRGRRRRLVGRG